MNACAGCRFFEAHSSGLGFGQCRRHAPAIVNGVNDERWPQVEAIDGCGDFEPALMRQPTVRLGTMTDPA